MTQLSIADVRKQYPEYQDLSDQQLADGIYRKSYSDMNRAEFDRKIGLNRPQGRPVDFDFEKHFDPAKSAAYEKSGFIDPLMQGLTFGLSDELSGVAGGALSAARGGSFGEGYTRTRDDVRASLAAYRDEKPVASTLAELGGAIGTLPAAGINVFRAPAAVSAGAPWMARMANMGARGAANVGNAAATGAAYGGAYAAGTAEGDIADRLDAAAGGATTGALFGAGAGAAIPAVGAAVRGVARAGRGLFSRDTEAARRIATAVAQDTQGQPAKAVQALQDAQATGSPMIAADTGETTRALARSAANTSPEARSALNASIDKRFETQNVRASEALRTVFGTQGNATASRDALEAAARTARKPFYDRAYREGADGVWTDSIEVLTDAPVMQRAMQAADESIRNKAATGRGVNNMGPNGPPLAYWDQVKRNLDSALSVAKRQGDNELAADIASIKAQLVAELDTAVPSYATARGVAAEIFKGTDALDAGERFVTAKIPLAEARKAWGKMGPEERDLFREGFVSKLVDDLMRIPDRRSVLNQIEASAAARAKIGMILGAGGQHKLEAFVLRESIMDLTRKALQGNSTTARQLAELGLAGGAGAYLSGGTSVYDPKAWLGFVIGAGMRRGVYKIDAGVAKRVGEMLASGDPKALQNLVNLAGRSPKVAGFLRDLEGSLQKALAPQSASRPLEVTVARGPYAEDNRSAQRENR